MLSGPTFAREVAAGNPTAVVVASSAPEVARCVQEAFSGPSFRLYTNADPVGVEVGAALKNVIAIGAGICEGLGLGHNPTAALITRGLAEITRLAIAMGGQAKTLAGLAGLGDLVLTCSGDLSRNRYVGKELGSGRPLRRDLGSMRMVAEGVETCASAVALGEKFGVDLPIIQQMHAVMSARKVPSRGRTGTHGPVPQRVSEVTQPSSETRVNQDMEAVVALERDAQLMLRVREGDDTSFAVVARTAPGTGGALPVPDGAESGGIGGAGSGGFPAGLPEPGDVRTDREVYHLAVPHRHACGAEFDTRPEKRKRPREPE